MAPVTRKARRLETGVLTIQVPEQKISGIYQLEKIQGDYYVKTLSRVVPLRKTPEEVQKIIDKKYGIRTELNCSGEGLYSIKPQEQPESRGGIFGMFRALYPK